MNKKNKILIIIPAYNEAENIMNTYEKIKKLKINNCNIDYVIINDGSTDATREICIKNKLNFIDLVTNLGIGGAMQTGYKYAKYNNYDIAIQFDGDGQHDQTYIKYLINEIVNEKYDLCIGSRFIGDLSQFQSTASRRVGINFLSWLIKFLTKKEIKDVTSGFRAANKKIITIFANDYPTDYPEPETIMKTIKSSYSIKEIPVKMHERTAGKSSINLTKSLYYMIKVSISIIIASITFNKGDEL
ncbi:MAG: glycosyltransferase family 2 protein [Bacilli bacterium]|nr:glycosyltransferase family 2 protein [Bacilli bacterium]MDD4808779.1 glycosyltransferase family 2 protein [Bacilli bacterium]